MYIFIQEIFGLASTNVLLKMTSKTDAIISKYAQDWSYISQSSVRGHFLASVITWIFCWVCKKGNQKTLSQYFKDSKVVKYCKVSIIHENFIFANICEFYPSRIQHYHEMFAYVEHHASRI